MKRVHTTSPNRFAIALLIGLLLPIITHADNSATQKAALNKIAKKIDSLKENIKSKQQHVDSVSSQLKSAEIQLGSLTKALEKSQSAIKNSEQKIHQLEQQQSQIQHHLDKQIKTLEVQLRATYYLGEQDYLKLLLNTENTTATSNTLDYFHYIYQAKLSLIDDIKNNLSQLEITKKEISKEKESLETFLQTKKKETEKIKQANLQRSQSIATLNKEIISNQSKISELNSQKESLEKIIKQLEISARQKPTSTKFNFTKAKGKLDWPTKGKITQHFGSTISSTNIKSNGVFIAATDGQNVKSIAPGKVIFSDWLKGYGLLIIIDHGNPYMSLYGHNRSLYAKVGDTVHSGTVIAKVGESGGLNKSGLYFEIRNNGKPVNPERWCQ